MRRHVSDAGTDVAALRSLVSSQELLAPLDESQKNQLLECAKITRFGRGERIIQQGSEGRSMFIIIRGEVDVVLRVHDMDTIVATLHDGGVFGEMCILTGEKRSATVRARIDCDLWEIDRAILQPLIQANTVLAERLSELLAHRRIENEGLLAAQTHPHVAEQKRKEYTLGFWRRIGALFEI